MSGAAHKGSDDNSVLAFLSPIAGAAFVLKLKYALLVVPGFLIGILIALSLRGLAGWKRFKVFLLGVTFLALVLFVSFGLPFSITTEGARFKGLAVRSDLFIELLVRGIRMLNGFPRLTKDMFVNVRKLTDLNVSQYFWLLLPWAVGATLLTEFYAWLKRRKPEAKLTPEGSFKVLTLPSQCVYYLYLGLLQVWVVIARDGIRNDTWGLARSAISAFLSLLFGIALSIALSIFVPYPELRVLLFVACLSPGVGLTIGFLWGFYEQLKAGLFHAKPENEQSGSFYLGKDPRKKPYYLTQKNLSYHVEIVASSGAGKTNLLKNLIYDRVKRGHGLVFLDLKADFDLVGWMLAVCREAGRESDLRLVSLADPEISIPYNPVFSGAAPEIHSQLMQAWVWSNDYYRSVSSVALMQVLQGLCEWRDATGERFHLGHIYRLLEEGGRLRSFTQDLLAKNLPSARETQKLCERLDRPSERKELAGLIANLNQLVFSAAGKLISTNLENGGGFDFQEATDAGRITYFLMNSLKLKESAATLGKLVLQDLMRVIGERYSVGGSGKLRPITLIIDEFGAFAIPEFIEFMDRARGAGCGIVIAHQSRADLTAVSPEFQKRIEANANTKIIGSMEDPQDREYYAKILGTKTTHKETIQVQEDWFGSHSTGMKSIREVEEFIVHPNHIASLERGEVFTLSRTVDQHHGFVRVPRAPEAPERSKNETFRQLTELKRCFEHGNARYLDLDSKTNAAAEQVDETIGLRREIPTPNAQRLIKGAGTSRKEVSAALDQPGNTGQAKAKKAEDPRFWD